MRYEVVERAQGFKMLRWTGANDRDKPSVAEMLAAIKTDLPDIPHEQLFVYGSGLRSEIIEVIPRTDSVPGQGAS